MPMTAGQGGGVGFGDSRLPESFWEKVNWRSAGCWEWRGKRSPQGYGRIGRTMVHRLSYETFIGPIPAGMYVCHTCDNRPCVNPTHLWVGTPKENADDMLAKGRGGQRKGADSRRKLTIDTVLEARIRVAGGESCYSVAKSFGVGHWTIRQAVDGTTWGWL